ncbi:FAD binding domain-containing protein [Neobacillus sp. SM06]|uniref:FAD binding domain-containing protein n=1 Tax=Neobacillus sp. SM06 TaxID=3422492 RepID=UPI003D2A8F29
MLPFDFDYYKPISLEEAVQLYHKLDHQGKQPVYFSGGTELITLGRLNLAYTEAVIDIKGILDLQAVEWSEDQLFLGSGVSLTKIADANVFPLLSQVASGIADHTAREKITLGGNVCARIFYREAALPFLLGGSQVVIAGPKGVRQASFNKLFSEQLQLDKGELVVQFVTDRKIVEAPFFAVKRRQQWEIGYPLITIAAVKINGELRVSVSGLCPFPFRSTEVEAFLNNRILSAAERIKGALEVLPGPILDDVEGSADYRLFVLGNLLEDVLMQFEGVGRV